MPDRWQTHAIEFKGGLVTNLSPLQQGANAPGSARTLRNYEPSTDGGYRSVLGYSKYDSTTVPCYGAPLVHGASQSGTTLILGNIFFSPVVGDTLTLAGVAGTYTVASGGVTFDATNKRVTLTLTGALDSSPADKAVATFTSGSGIIQGVSTFESFVLAARNADLFKSTGSGWTKVNTPNYGPVLVEGASQTGTSLDVDGITGTPQAGDTFTIAGVALIYTLTATPTVTSGAATFAINPALATSPANNAAITMLSVDRSGLSKHRFVQFNYSGTDFLAGVDGVNPPFVYDGNTFTVLDGIPAEGVGAGHVANFKNHLFFGSGSKIIFTSPFTSSDFSPANGAGIINVGNTITGLIVFREQLIIFSERTIFRLVGSSTGDFQLQPIALDTGCVEPDTIQEIGGDVIYVGPDGIRSLSATEKVGDFNLAVVSKIIQEKARDFINRNTSFSSVVIRPKSQYRLLGYNANFSQDASQAIVGSQVEQGINFSELRGFKAYVASSNLNEDIETIVFANEDGYVYSMESGNSMDGAEIFSTFATPYIPINDPRVRKTFYKMFLYTDPQGSYSADVNLLYDFDEAGIVQPETFSFDNTSGSSVPAFYGASVYGTGTYGGTVQRLFEKQTVGSGYVVSVEFRTNSTNPPHSLDALTLEYGTYGRR